MYREDLESLDSIGVLCRGGSLVAIKRASKLFDHCFIVGQFENALKKMGKVIRGKTIVQVINKSTIKTSRKTCAKYGIKDLQCNFDGWLTRTMSENKQRLFAKIKKTNPWLTAHLAPLGIRERRGPHVDWATTGIFAVDLACFFGIKKIVIVGLDFYESDYFAQERVVASAKSNRKRSKIMRRYFGAIVDRDSDKQFIVYTKSKRLKERENLKVVRV